MASLDEGPQPVCDDLHALRPGLVHRHLVFSCGSSLDIHKLEHVAPRLHNLVVGLNEILAQLLKNYSLDRLVECRRGPIPETGTPDGQEVLSNERYLHIRVQVQGSDEGRT